MIRALSSKRITKPKGHNMQDQDYLLTTRQVAKMLGLAPYTIAKFRMKKIGPKYFNMGKNTVRYRKSDVLAWLDRISKENRI